MSAKKNQSRLIVFTGEGKGKTSAALGTVVRALGNNGNPAVVQFIKDEFPTSERAFFHRFFPEMIFESLGAGLTVKPGDHRAAARAAWERACELIRNHPGELLVLDELCVAIRQGFVSEAEVCEVLAARPEHLHVIVTGRDAPESLCALADTVSEIAARKHAFEQGLPALRGLDF